MSLHSRRICGQVLTEFVILVPVVIATVGGIAALGRAQWNRARCAHQVFSAVHDHLYNNPLTALRSQVWISESETHVTGTAICGDTKQTVSLEKI